MKTIICRLQFMDMGEKTGQQTIFLLPENDNGAAPLF
jgi:hypothetical protein